MWCEVSVCEWAESAGRCLSHTEQIHTSVLDVKWREVCKPHVIVCQQKAKPQRSQTHIITHHMTEEVSTGRQIWHMNFFTITIYSNLTIQKVNSHFSILVKFILVNVYATIVSSFIHSQNKIILSINNDCVVVFPAPPSLIGQIDVSVPPTASLIQRLSSVQALKQINVWKASQNLLKNIIL